MRRSVEAEILADSRRKKQLTVDTSVRACVNCQYYEQYFHQSRGNIALWIPTCEGYCLKREEHMGALHPACSEFLKEERKEKHG
jgi:hypothetical protein